jgi:hypothetical protein
MTEHLDHRRRREGAHDAEGRLSRVEPLLERVLTHDRRSIRELVVPLAAGLVLVPVLDHAVKLAVRHALAQRAVSLGSLGELRAGPADIWIGRAGRRVTPLAMWIVWIAAAAAVVVFDARLSWSGWFPGLLLGGSLSHALEISMRGAVCDYVRLRFWPAFDLADVAIAAGAGGLLAELVAALRATQP